MNLGTDALNERVQAPSRARWILRRFAIGTGIVVEAVVVTSGAGWLTIEGDGNVHVVQADVVGLSAECRGVW